MSPSKITLSGETLTLNDVAMVARQHATVTLGSQARKKINTASQLIEKFVDSGEIIYGVTTGFGPFSDTVISSDKARELQRSLIISHAAGVGAQLPKEIVRAAMLLRANTLAKGNSGVRSAIIELLINLLNKGVHPVIPEQGSVGASGDLAPLSHMALVLIGEGYAEYQGEILPGIEALKRAGLTPIQLEEKEGIALINGTQIMTAIAALAVVDAKILVACAEISAALAIEALEGILDAFDPRIHEVRPHPGQKRSAKNLLELLNKSSLVQTSRERAILAQQAAKQFHEAILHDHDQDPETMKTILTLAIQAVIDLDQQILVESTESAQSIKLQRQRIKEHFIAIGISPETFEAAIEMARKSRRVQDAYSLRCTPQVIGAARDAVEYIERIISVEINSATDNPLIFPTTKTFLSGGNFHGQPVAIAMDLLGIAITSLGNISERRIARLIDNKLSNGLPLLLLHPTLEDRGVHFGLGLAQITAAALAAESRILTNPASIQSIPTAANQEDHVSMGTIGARHARTIIHNVENIIAVELLCAAQGVDIRQLRKPVTLGKGTRVAYQIVRSTLPRIFDENGIQRDRISDDVLIHKDIEMLQKLVQSGDLLRQVQNAVPSFSI